MNPALEEHSDLYLLCHAFLSIKVSMNYLTTEYDRTTNMHNTVSFYFVFGKFLSAGRKQKKKIGRMKAKGKE